LKGFRLVWTIATTFFIWGICNEKGRGMHDLLNLDLDTIIGVQNYFKSRESLKLEYCCGRSIFRGRNKNFNLRLYEEVREAWERKEIERYYNSLGKFCECDWSIVRYGRKNNVVRELQKIRNLFHIGFDKLLFENDSLYWTRSGL